MRYLIFILALIAFGAGCTDRPGVDQAAASEPANAALSTPASPPPALAGAAGFALSANCYARLRAMSRLYSVIAQQSSGAERQEMANLAFERELASTEYQLVANRLAGELGHTVEQSARAYRAAEAAVGREQASRAFDDFLIWLAGESDRCPPLPAEARL